MLEEVEGDEREDVDDAFFTLGEGKMLPKHILSSEIHSSFGPLFIVRLTKQVIIEMYRIII